MRGFADTISRRGFAKQIRNDAMVAALESYLVLSDVHLGSDLNDSGPVVTRSRAIDADLAALLAHYRAAAPPAGGRWHLVLAGDFIDFVGMAIDPVVDDAVATERERRYGLFGAEAHVREKCRRVAARHPDVFAELRRLVAAGHGVTFVSGNHDMEMHWPAVQADLRALLGGTEQSIAFEPWLFYRRGVVFVEHGHQYDPFCASPFVLAPVSPADPSRVAPSLSDTLLRYVVRRTPGMREYGHEDRGLASYVSWGLGLGARGTAALFGRFVDAIGDLVRAARAHRSEAATAILAEQRRRLAALAGRIGVTEAELDRALGLHATSLATSPRLVLASVMLDRLGVGLAMLFLGALLAAAWTRLGPLGPVAALGLAVTWIALHVLFSRGRPSVDPAAEMERRAAELAALFPSAFVVMGHTHVPASAEVGAATYLNTGSWAEEEPDPAFDPAKAYRAARTHVVVAPQADGRHVAELRAWRSGEGPVTRSMHVAATRAEPAGDTARTLAAGAT